MTEPAAAAGEPLRRHDDILPVGNRPAPPPHREVLRPGSVHRWGLTTGGTIVAVVILIAGLAVLAYVVMFVVAFANWGNNK